MDLKIRATGVGANQRGFSLIELLVVIFIIIVIVAITIPALGIARKAARKHETQALLNKLGTAVVQFEGDNKRTPGYFSAREMGNPENANTRGFSGMQNLLLDLSGGVVDPATPVTGTVVDVGPLPGPNTVKINHALIGVATATSKTYFAPSRKAFVTQDGTQGSRFGVIEHQFPELVDAFGTPILAWVQDPTAVQPIASVDDFVQVHAGLPAAPTPARFYLGSNSAFLTAGPLVGKRGVDQGDRSMLGTVEWADTHAPQSLTGLVGNPNSPLNIADTNVQMDAILPSAPRGSVVFHSAGEDGAFLPRDSGGSPIVKDGGTAQCFDASSGEAVLHYGYNFSSGGISRLPNSTDMVRVFNDLIHASGQ